MRARTAALLASAAVSILLGVGAKQHRLVDRWLNPGFEHRHFERVIVIGITDDDRARRVFEDLFVTHLRGRKIDSVTSYSFAPELEIDDEGVRQAILAAIEEERIDGAISVRAVPLKKLGEEAWAARWQRQIDESQTLRALIEETLPFERGRSGRYGIEVALWGVKESSRIWAARTTPYTAKQMRNGAPEFVQYTMHALEIADLLEGTSP